MCSIIRGKPTQLQAAGLGFSFQTLLLDQGLFYSIPDCLGSGSSLSQGCPGSYLSAVLDFTPYTTVAVFQRHHKDRAETRTGLLEATLRHCVLYATATYRMSIVLSFMYQAVELEFLA